MGASSVTTQLVDSTNINPQETSHVTEELYKKNFELAETNITLSLLSTIDDIILGSATDVKQIAQQVVDKVASEAQFKAVAIYMVSEDHLNLLAVSSTPYVQKIFSNSPQMYVTSLPLSENNNLIVRSVLDKTIKTTHSFRDLVTTSHTENNPLNVPFSDEIVSSIICPLFMKNNAIIGTIIINLGKSEDTLFTYQRKLIERLLGVIGIALNNALLYKKLEDANERLKGLDKLKDEFVSLASHELRTPMTAIKSYLWLVLQQRGDLGTLTEKQKVYLDRVYFSTERLIKLVNDMLNVSRIESGRMTINLKPTNLLQLINDVTAEVLPSIQNQQLSLIVKPPSDALPNVQADSEKLKEVFINLIGNSLKFTPAGGSITVSFSKQNDMIVTAITDTGKGIKTEDMPKLFQKFGMIEGNYFAKPSTQGTGLGLYITKSIIELHGGTVTVASEGENKGTTFTFSLKIAN